MRRRHVLLVGGGHAHLRLLHRMNPEAVDHLQVTLVDRQEVLWYSGMMPAVLGGRVAPAAARIPIREAAERVGALYVRGNADRIDTTRRCAQLADGRELQWDVLSLAVGSTVRSLFPIADEAKPMVFGAKPVAELQTIAQRVVSLLAEREGPVRVVFVGGGASAIELSGNLDRRLRAEHVAERGRVSICLAARGQRLAPGFPPNVGRLAGRSLSGRGIEVCLRQEVVGIDGGGVRMADGSRRAADVVVLTTGLVPPRLIERSGLPHDEHGALTVRGDLKVPGLPIFGGGDCISVAGADVMRVGVHAIRQGPILWRNIRSVLGDAGAQPSARYEPEQKPLLILNLGDGTGLATWRGRARRNRLWMAIKERIDWQFVRTTGKEVRIGLQAPPRPGDDRVETPKPMRGREK